MLTGILILACWVFLGVYWNISARSIKPTAEGQDWSGRLARMPIWLGYILLLSSGRIRLEWWRYDGRPFRAGSRWRSARWGCWCPYGHAGRWATSGAEMSN